MVISDAIFFQKSRKSIFRGQVVKNHCGKKECMEKSPTEKSPATFCHLWRKALCHFFHTHGENSTSFFSDHGQKQICIASQFIVEDFTAVFKPVSPSALHIVIKFVI